RTTSPFYLYHATSTTAIYTLSLHDALPISATLDYIKQCRESGINGLAGMEFRNTNQLLYVGIAKNEEGFKELNDLMTFANRTKSDRKSTRLNSSHVKISYAVFCLKKKTKYR